MKSVIHILSAVLAICLIPVPGKAADQTDYVSPTFQDILKRVTVRDKETRAILQVRRKEDTRLISWDLSFSMREWPESGEATIELYVTYKDGNGIYEQYLLRIDKAIREELDNLKRFKEAQPARLAKEIEEKKKRIQEVTKGKLTYGMTQEEVEKVLGKPSSRDVPHQEFGSFGLLYPGMKLEFRMERLDDVVKEEIQRK
jgi:hypothetical protein